MRTFRPWGVAFPEGPELLPFFRKKRGNFYHFHRPFPVGQFRLTHTNFSSACCACDKGGGGRVKIAEIAERAAHFGRQSVKEEGAAGVLLHATNSHELQYRRSALLMPRSTRDRGVALAALAS